MDISCRNAGVAGVAAKPEARLLQDSWRTLMSDLAFLLARGLSSVRREYNAPMREGFFTKTETASFPPLIHRASNKETQYSIPGLVGNELRIYKTRCKAPVPRIALVPSGFFARVARTARESVTRSSLSEDVKRLTSKGTASDASSFQWLSGKVRRPKIATNAFFWPRSVLVLMSVGVFRSL